MKEKVIKVITIVLIAVILIGFIFVVVKNAKSNKEDNAAPIASTNNDDKSLSDGQLLEKYGEEYDNAAGVYINDTTLTYTDQYNGIISIGKKSSDTDKLKLAINYQGDSSKVYGVELTCLNNGTTDNDNKSNNTEDVSAGTYVIDQYTGKYIGKGSEEHWYSTNFDNEDKILNIRVYNISDSQFLGTYTVYAGFDNNKKIVLTKISNDDINNGDDIRYRDELCKQAENDLISKNVSYYTGFIDSLYPDMDTIEKVDQTYRVQTHAVTGSDILYSGKIDTYPLYAVTINFKYKANDRDGNDITRNTYSTLYYKKVNSNNGVYFELYCWSLPY